MDELARTAVAGYRTPVIHMELGSLAIELGLGDIGALPAWRGLRRSQSIGGMNDEATADLSYRGGNPVWCLKE